MKEKKIKSALISDFEFRINNRGNEFLQVDIYGKISKESTVLMSIRHHVVNFVKYQTEIHLSFYLMNLFEERKYKKNELLSGLKTWEKEIHSYLEKLKEEKVTDEFLNSLPEILN
jgi:hypothetical protein